MKKMFCCFIRWVLIAIIVVFLFGCDPIRIDYDPVEIIFPQYDPNYVNNQKEYDEWVNTLDPNFAGSLGL